MKIEDLRENVDANVYANDLKNGDKIARTAIARVVAMIGIITTNDDNLL